MLTFYGQESLNQHICYFKAQISNVVSNDAILARLFIGTFKGVTIEWFKKLLEGSINTWSELEKLFSSKFFKDDTEIAIPTLLDIKQENREPVKAFIE